MKNDTDTNMIAGSEANGDRTQVAATAAERAAALSNQVLESMMRDKNATGGSTDKAQNSSGSSELQHKQQKGLTSEEKESFLKDRSASDRMKNGEQIENFKKQKHEFVVKPLEDGIRKLSTGDTLVKDGDRELLFMPNGDKLSVNKDGSFDLKSSGGVQVKKEGGMTTITFANGDTVSFSKYGIDGITRGNQTVDLISGEMFHNMRRQLDQHLKEKGGELHRPGQLERLPNNSDRLVPNRQSSGGGGGSIEIPADLYEKLQRK